MDKINEYQQLLANLDRKGRVPLGRDDASDAKLADIILLADIHGQEEKDACRDLVETAIDIYYKRRPITLRTMLRAQEELEGSREGRVLLALDSSVFAFAYQTMAAVSAVTGVYELAAVFFAVGTYEAYDAIRLSRVSNDG